MRDVIDKYAALPFEYNLDCCQFVGDCIEALTGTNPMRHFIYSGEDEAQALIKSYGSLEACIRSEFGDPYEGVKDGDVLLYEQQNDEPIAGIAYRGRGVVRVKGGLTDWPIEWARLIWSYN